MSEPTLRQLFNNDIEEIHFSGSFINGYWPIFNSNYLTNLKKIIQDDFETTQVNLQTPAQIASEYLEQLKFNREIYLQGCKRLQEAHIRSVFAMNSYSFFNCGTMSETGKADIYTLGETASQIHSKCNNIGTYWTKTIVFHGNDGNKVAWDATTSSWVVSPDS